MEESLEKKEFGLHTVPWWDCHWEGQIMPVITRNFSLCVMWRLIPLGKLGSDHWFNSHRSLYSRQAVMTFSPCRSRLVALRCACFKAVFSLCHSSAEKVEDGISNKIVLVPKATLPFLFWSCNVRLGIERTLNCNDFYWPIKWGWVQRAVHKCSLIWAVMNFQPASLLFSSLSSPSPLSASFLLSFSSSFPSLLLSVSLFSLFSFPPSRHADPGELTPGHPANAGECSASLLLCLLHLWHHWSAIVGWSAPEPLFHGGKLHNVSEWEMLSPCPVCGRCLFPSLPLISFCPLSQEFQGINISRLYPIFHLSLPQAQKLPFLSQ